MRKADQQMNHFHTTEDYAVTKKQKEAPADAKLTTKKEAKKAKRDDPVELIRVENQTWEQQQNIRKVILVEAGNESASDYESDVEELATRGTSSGYRGARKEGDMFGEYAYRRDKIFKYLTIQDKNVTLPSQTKDE